MQACLCRESMERELQARDRAAEKQRQYEAEQTAIAARLLASILAGESQEDWQPTLEELDDADMVIEVSNGRRVLHFAVAHGNTGLAEAALRFGASSVSPDKSGCSALDLCRQMVLHHRRRADYDPKRKNAFEQLLILLEHEGLNAEATVIEDDFAASLAQSQALAQEKTVSLERSGILYLPPPPLGPPNSTLAKILNATRRPEFDKLFDASPSKRAAYLDQFVPADESSGSIEAIPDDEAALTEKVVVSADVLEADATIASIESAMVRSTATLAQLTQPLWPPTPPRTPTPQPEPDPESCSVRATKS